MGIKLVLPVLIGIVVLGLFGFTNVYADHTDPYVGTDGHCALELGALNFGDDFSNCNFSGLNIEPACSNQEYLWGSGTDFTRANLTGVNFDGCSISEADFSFAILSGGIFGTGNSANFTGANLFNAVIADVRFADLTGANITQTRESTTSFALDAFNSVSGSICGEGTIKSVDERGIRTCVSDDTALDTCNANLDTANADLNTCDASLSTCSGDLSTCSDDLGTANTDLGTCNTDLSTAQGDLSSCQTDLSMCVGEEAQLTEEECADIQANIDKKTLKEQNIPPKLLENQFICDGLYS